MNTQSLRRGFIHVYTGSGKGKTTAALGICLRALGHGLRCKVFQFMKGNIRYGELQAANRLAPDLVIEQCGRESFVSKTDPDPIDVTLAREALIRARTEIMNDSWDIVVLDEINVALDFKLVSLDDVLSILKSKPVRLELILTGRYAPQLVMDAADLITEMQEIKHYYRTGVMSRAGIDY